MDDRSLKVVQLWKMAAKSGKIPPDQIAGAVYFGVTDSPPPPEVVGIPSAMELLDYFNRKDTGRSFTTEERQSLAREIIGMQKSGRTPSLGFMRLLTWIPNIAVLLAIIAVVVGAFSWIVLGLGLAGKIQNGFAKFLAGQGHPGAGQHIGIALILILSSLVVSLLHIFSRYQFI